MSAKQYGAIDAQAEEARLRAALEAVKQCLESGRFTKALVVARTAVRSQPNGHNS